MSALRMIAWGMVDLDNIPEADFQAVRRQVRKELLTHHMRLEANGSQTYRLIKTHHNGMRLGKRKRQVRCNRDFRSCCKRALEIIEAQHPHTTER